MMSQMTTTTNRTLVNFPLNYYTLGIFAIAMGAFEAIVVIYLRQIYYPEGFNFPLTFLSSQMVAIEWIREVATIVMLVCIGIIAGRNWLQRLACFLYCFAIWDIFYYIWLKLLIDWPASFLTWDILFLIPVPWIGPVLAPVIASLTMILMAGIIINGQHRNAAFRIKSFEWSLIFLGVLIILGTFIWDYAQIIIKDGFLSRFWTLADDQQFQKIIAAYHPTSFNWVVFIIGEIFILAALILILRRARPAIH
jgi:hypothetical protein